MVVSVVSGRLLMRSVPDSGGCSWFRHPEPPPPPAASAATLGFLGGQAVAINGEWGGMRGVWGNWGMLLYTH